RYAMPSRHAFAAALFLALAACGGTSSSDVPVPDANVDEGPDTAEDVSDLTAGKVTLRIPLLDENGKLLSRHNAALHAGGLGPFPGLVEIQGGANGSMLAHGDDKVTAASTLVDKAYEKLHLEIPMRSY